jgi:hypothetical protein
VIETIKVVDPSKARRILDPSLVLIAYTALEGYAGFLVADQIVFFEESIVTDAGETYRGTSVKLRNGDVVRMRESITEFIERIVHA